MRTRRHKRQKRTKRRMSRKLMTRKRGGGWFDFWKPKTNCVFDSTITPIADTDIKFIDDCCSSKKYYFFGDKTLKPAYDQNGKLTSCGLAYNVVKNSTASNTEQRRKQLKDEISQKQGQGQQRIATGFIQASPDKL